VTTMKQKFWLDFSKELRLSFDLVYVLQICGLSMSIPCLIDYRKPNSLNYHIFKYCSPFVTLTLPILFKKSWRLKYKINFYGYLNLVLFAKAKDDVIRSHTTVI
jgi:hypothetical protein